MSLTVADWDPQPVQRASPTVARCYLIVAGYPSRWRLEVADIFGPDQDARIWDARDMFDRWQKAWRDLLRGGRARPQRVPAYVRVRPIWRGTIDAFASEGYECQCVAVEAISQCGWLWFEGDRPEPPRAV